MRDERRREFAERPVREPAARRLGLPGRCRKPCARPWRSIWPAQAPAREARRRPVRHRRAARQSGGRLAILSRRLPHAAARTPRPHVRDPGHLALRRAREIRPDAQELLARRWARPSPISAWWTGWQSAAASAVQMEDYCHSFEHTVELQVVFLQHVLGPDVKILPILCGPFAQQPVPGRRSGGRRRREALPRRARRIERPRRRPPVLGARRRHGPHGRAATETASRPWPTRA